MARQYYVGDSVRLNTFVAVDFGTTYSAFCFALGKNSEDYHVQPDSGGRKIPTAMLLNPDTSLHSFGEKVLDNFLALDEDEAESFYLFDRFKMKLQADRNVRADMPLKASNSDRTLPAKLVFTRALEYFYDLAKKAIALSSGAWIEDEVKWVLTVPAIWGDRARDFMRQAAYDAGIASKYSPESFEIALEPEGAALTCRDKLMHVWRQFGKPAMLRYMVVDCGGGTIDVTVHDLNMSSSEIKEVHCATGDAWGGTYVDEKIQMLIKRILGEKVARELTNDDWLRFTRVSIENAKRSISDESDQVFFDIPHEMHMAISASGGSLEKAAQSFPGARARRGRLSLDVHLVEDCFTESLDNITKHVRELLHVVNRETPVRCILVVGGFVESPFLIHRIEEEFSSVECRVLRPQDASTAVVKGAVIYGQCPDVITARILKFTYGVRILGKFDPSVHPQSKFKMTDSGPRCRDIFWKFVFANDVVEIGKPVKESFWPCEKDQTEVSFVVFRSTKRNAIFTDDPSCERLLTTTLPSPNTEKGLDRELKVTFDFSRTLLRFHAIDVSSGEFVQADIHFD